MTREEAVRYFKRHIDLYCVEGICREAEEMAIKALEQEPCEDVISRADARHLIAETDRKDLGCISTKAFKILYNGIDALQPVTPQPKIGHWLKDSKGTLCSICRGYAIDDEGLVILTDYCPWCGAKMQGVEE